MHDLSPCHALFRLLEAWSGGQPQAARKSRLRQLATFNVAVIVFVPEEVWTTAVILCRPLARLRVS
jgi:hypothetical protein